MKNKKIFLTTIISIIIIILASVILIFWRNNNVEKTKKEFLSFADFPFKDDIATKSNYIKFSGPLSYLQEEQTNDVNGRHTFIYDKYKFVIDCNSNECVTGATEALLMCTSNSLKLNDKVIYKDSSEDKKYKEESKYPYIIITNDNIIIQTLNKLYILDSNGNIQLSINNINEEYKNGYDYSNYNMERHNLVKSVTANSLKQMIDQKEDFCFFVHADECEGCQKIRPLLIKYIYQTNLVIYTYDITPGDNFEAIESLAPSIIDANGDEVFPKTTYTTRVNTPLFYFFKDGVLTHKQFVTSNMLNYSFFSKTFDKFLSKSTSELINEYNDSYNSQYVYYYDNSSSAKVDLYKEIIKDSSLSLKIIRNDTSVATYKSMIRNESLNKVLEITDETTIDDIKTFIN